MEMIVKNFNKMLMVSMGMLLFDFIVGVFLITSSSFAVSVGTIVLGSLFIIHGLFSIIRYIYDGINNRVFVVDLVFAVASVILGAFSIFNTMDAIKLLGIVVGLWLVIRGCCKLSYAIVFYKQSEEIYPLITFISIMILIMGVLVLLNPFESFMLITKLIGYFMVASSLLDFMYYLLFKKRSKYILKMFE